MDVYQQANEGLTQSTAGVLPIPFYVWVAILLVLGFVLYHFISGSASDTGRS